MTSADTRNRANELAIVGAYLPDDDPTEIVLAHVIDFGPHRLRIVVGDPRSIERIVEPRHLGRRLPMAYVARIVEPRARQAAPVTIRFMPITWLAGRRLIQ